uniref:Transmembrane protein 223 n=1 Tax=Clastoptera arizonana TaxID=38151 RepID=A0A1B6CAU7_9HEMI
MSLILKLIGHKRTNFFLPFTLLHLKGSNTPTCKLLIHICNKCRTITPLNQKPVINLKTGIIKDVILFKSNNTDKHHRIYGIFGITQFVFWAYMAEFTFNFLKNIPPAKDENAPWFSKMNLGEPKYRYTLCFASLIIGFIFLAGSWFYTLRSVKYLILRKGGKDIAFVTFTPFGENRIMNVPLDKISALESRMNCRVTMPIKVQHKLFYYMLDMRGEFLNPKLFDFTAGLKRTLK